MAAAVSTLAILSPLAASPGSGVADVRASSANSRAQGSHARVSAPVHCRSARVGLRFYRSRYVIHVQRRTGNYKPVITGRKPRSCADARYLAKLWRMRSLEARRAYERWHAYHYDWTTWLPDKWQRVGACETGYGQRPGRWDWNSGSYQGAFGFAVSSWDGFVSSADPKAGPYPSEAYLATPRQQYEVALAIWRRYGFSGWGCRGA